MPPYAQSVLNLPAQIEGNVTDHSCHNNEERCTAILDFQTACSVKENCRQN